MHRYASMAVAAALTLGVAVAAQAGNRECHYNGSSFSNGATACQAGTQFRCDDGEWESLSVACGAKDTGAKSCDYGGKTYSAGSASCQSGVQFRCENGMWNDLAVACSPDVVAAPRVQPAPLRTCMMEGSTVASSSTVCKSGEMYMCEDGQWRNLGTPCR
jgi:hypothetical protein